MPVLCKQCVVFVIELLLTQKTAFVHCCEFNCAGDWLTVSAQDAAQCDSKESLKGRNE